jgi:hypothetical protein
MGSLKEGLLWCPDSAKKAQDSFPVKRWICQCCLVLDFI